MRLIWLLLLVAAVATGCSGSSRGDARAAAVSVLNKVPKERLLALQDLRIFFGHQSVGAEIVSGLAEVSGAVGISLRIQELSDPGLAASPGFFHALNGVNEEPLTKIESFSSTVESALAGRVDVAFFKFCYVDIHEKSDVDALFESYSAAMDALRNRHPAVTFVHVTSPVTVVQPGWKVWFKKVLGRPQRDYAQNAARSKFNRRMLETFAGREPVFDLAAVESTHPDGTRETFAFDGDVLPALIPAYSYDGRHLNESGRAWVAAHLLGFLADLPDPR